MTSFDRTIVYGEFDKVKYIDELILKLQSLYSQNIVDEVFFDKALELLNQEKMELSSSSVNYDDNYEVEFLETDIEDMSPEERRRHFEIEKHGVKMKLLEAKNFSQLDILYNRISKDIDDSLNDFLKIEFTDRFKKVFKTSYMYYLIQDHLKKHGRLDLDELVIIDDKLILKNERYECSINKAICLEEDIRYVDEDELNSLKSIINKSELCFTEDFVEENLRNVIVLPEAVVSFEQRIEKIEDTIETILNRDENRFFRSMISIKSDFKFEEKLKKCKTIYDNSFEGEIPLLIFDNTIFKTCQNGFIITDKNLYLKQSDVYNVNVDDLESIELEDGDLIVNNSAVRCDIIKSTYREKFKDTILIIAYLVQNGIDESKKIDKVIEEVISI